MASKKIIKAALPTLESAIDKLCAGVKTQSGQHIKEFNRYCATRLILEGGIPPEWIQPRPHLESKRINNRKYSLMRSPGAASDSEREVLGGIKYKNVDVTVLVPAVGPALCVSAKSTANAFRNLTNRMEEALGDCTNLHLMYPGLVFGFIHFIKLGKIGEVALPDASFDQKLKPLPAIERYHEVLCSLTGRTSITDPGTRYEAVAMVVYACGDGQRKPTIWDKYPAENSPVHFSRFFDRLYRTYDIRFAYPNPGGPNARKEWVVTDLPSSIESNLGFPAEVRRSSD